MREAKYETVEIMVDAELLEQLKPIIEPMGPYARESGRTVYRVVCGTGNTERSHLTSYKVERRNGAVISSE